MKTAGERHHSGRRPIPGFRIAAAGGQDGVGSGHRGAIGRNCPAEVQRLPGYGGVERNILSGHRSCSRAYPSAAA